MLPTSAEPVGAVRGGIPREFDDPLRHFAAGLGLIPSPDDLFS
jgi:hypothetical protein